MNEGIPINHENNINRLSGSEIPMQERLKLATEQYSLGLLAKVAVGDTTETAFDFATNASLVTDLQQQGTLTAVIDTAAGNQWNAGRPKATDATLQRWAERATKSCFNDTNMIEQSGLLQHLGFEATSHTPIQEQVTTFLKTTFHERYGGVNGNEALAERLTQHIIDARSVKEIQMTRQLLARNKRFFTRMFGKENVDTFYASVELRIAAKLNAFAYEEAVQEDQHNTTFYTEPLRSHEPPILRTLAQAGVTNAPAVRRPQRERKRDTVATSKPDGGSRNVSGEPGAWVQQPVAINSDSDIQATPVAHQEESAEQVQEENHEAASSPRLERMLKRGNYEVILSDEPGVVSVAEMFAQLGGKAEEQALTFVSTDDYRYTLLWGDLTIEYGKGAILERPQERFDPKEGGMTPYEMKQEHTRPLILQVENMKTGGRYGEIVVHKADYLFFIYNGPRKLDRSLR